MSTPAPGSAPAGDDPEDPNGYLEKLYRVLKGYQGLQTGFERVALIGVAMVPLGCVLAVGYCVLAFFDISATILVRTATAINGVLSPELLGPGEYPGAIFMVIAGGLLSLLLLLIAILFFVGLIRRIFGR